MGEKWEILIFFSRPCIVNLCLLNHDAFGWVAADPDLKYRSFWASLRAVAQKQQYHPPRDHPLVLLPSLQMPMWSLGDRAVLVVCGLGLESNGAVIKSLLDYCMTEQILKLFRPQFPHL